MSQSQNSIYPVSKLEVTSTKASGNGMIRSVVGSLILLVLFLVVGSQLNMSNPLLVMFSPILAAIYIVAFKHVMKGYTDTE